MIAALLLPLLSFAAGVHVAELRGSINPGSSAYVLESLRAAQADSASLFVLRLDTPGGLLSSARSMIQGFGESSVPVAVWVAPSGASATSAGALIALSAHAVAMQDGTNLGAAHPVGGSGEDIKGVMGVKVTNDTAALARAQALLHGRPPETAEELVTKSRSFTASEAVAAHLADFLAGDLPSLLHQLDGRTVRVGQPARAVVLRLPAEVQITQHAMSARQAFLHFISDPNVSTVLISLGGFALWAEVQSGFTSIAAGVLGVLCFTLGFVSLETLPVNVGGEILLVLGFLLLVADAFVTSHGLLSVGAIVCIFLGGLFLMDPGASTMRVSLSLLLPLVGSLATVVGAVAFALWRGRGRHVRVNAVVHAEAAISTVEAGGLTGTAYVNGELWKFRSEEPVRPGDSLHVSSVDGLLLHFKRRRT